VSSTLESIPIIALSSFPGTNIITGFIKFFIYLNKESELVAEIRRHTLNSTAEKVDELLKGIENDVSNLKWFSLLQMIPLVGIIGVLFEQRILSKYNQKTDEEQGPDNESTENLYERNVINLTNNNFDTTISTSDKCMVLFYDESSFNDQANRNAKEEFKKAASKMPTVIFGMVNCQDKDNTNQIKLPADYKVKRFPSIFIYISGILTLKDTKGGSCDWSIRIGKHLLTYFT
jgi:hypothetical protein